MGTRQGQKLSRFLVAARGSRCVSQAKAKFRASIDVRLRYSIFCPKWFLNDGAPTII